MSLSYAVYVRHEVYQNLTEAGDSCDQILSFIETLAVDPFQEGDLSASDDGGRDYQVKIVGSFAVYYWCDHVEKEVRVVDLVDAENLLA